MRRWLTTRLPMVVLTLAGTLCSAAPSTAGAGGEGVELENTRWDLIQLGDQQVAPASGQRQTHLVLWSDKGQADGSDGCNRFFGGYRLEGERIAFDRMAATRMFCVGLMENAKAFHAALSETSNWKVTGEYLELFDASGKLLARFEAADPS